MSLPPELKRRARRIDDPKTIKENPVQEKASKKKHNKLVLPAFRWVRPAPTDDDVIITQQEVLDFEQIFGISMATLLTKWNKLYVD